MLECWNVGILGFWDAGILECWNSGMLGLGDKDVEDLLKICGGLELRMLGWLSYEL